MYNSTWNRPLLPISLALLATKTLATKTLALGVLGGSMQLGLCVRTGFPCSRPVGKGTLWFAGLGGVLASFLQKLAVVPWHGRLEKFFTPVWSLSRSHRPVVAIRTTYQTTAPHTLDMDPFHLAHLLEVVIGA